MGLETIIGAIVTVIGLIAAAVGLGHAKGKRQAEAKADRLRTEDNAAAVTAAAERRVKVTREAADVQQSVNHLPDDDVDRQLRDKWTRQAGGGGHGLRLGFPDTGNPSRY